MNKQRKVISEDEMNELRHKYVHEGYSLQMLHDEYGHAMATLSGWLRKEINRKKGTFDKRGSYYRRLKKKQAEDALKVPKSEPDSSGASVGGSASDSPSKQSGAGSPPKRKKRKIIKL